MIISTDSELVDAITRLQNLQVEAGTAAAAGTLDGLRVGDGLTELVTAGIDYIILSRGPSLVVDEFIDPLVNWVKSDVLAEWVQHPTRDRTPYMQVLSAVSEIQEKYAYLA